jgi:hypothetical protein
MAGSKDQNFGIDDDLFMAYLLTLSVDQIAYRQIVVQSVNNGL